MGVGKVKGASLSATMNFFRAGIDVCLTQPGHIGFVRVLEQYLRLLPPSNIKIISDYFHEKLENNDEFQNILNENDANGDKEVESFLDFNSLLSGKIRTKKSLDDTENSSQGSPESVRENKGKQGKNGKNVKNRKMFSFIFSHTFWGSLRRILSIIQRFFCSNFTT